MNWKELLSELDDIRAKIRANRDVNAVTTSEDPILRDLGHLLENAGTAKKRTKLIEVEVDDEGNPTYPVSKAEFGRGGDVGTTEDIQVEGKTVKRVVLPRDKRPELTPPILEEADEKTVGKD